MTFVEQFVEKAPRGQPSRRLHPYIRGVTSTIGRNTQGLKSFIDNPCVLKVKGNLLCSLSLPVGTQGGQPTSLNDVRCSVEEGILAPGPKGVQLAG